MCTRDALPEPAEPPPPPQELAATATDTQTNAVAQPRKWPMEPPSAVRYDSGHPMTGCIPAPYGRFGKTGGPIFGPKVPKFDTYRTTEGRGSGPVGSAGGADRLLRPAPAVTGPLAVVGL